MFKNKYIIGIVLAILTGFSSCADLDLAPLPKILDPRDTYDCACKWEEKAKDLAGRFIKNFEKFTGNEAGKKLVAAGPKL